MNYSKIFNSIEKKISRKINRLYYLLYQILIPNKSSLKIEKVGTLKGGWYIPVDIVKKDWICYCGGVGGNISFDIGLIERFGCNIYAFDPTNRAIEFIDSYKDLPQDFHFLPIGLWNENCTLKFFLPKLNHSFNYSIKNLEDTSDYIEAQCKRISTILKELNHSKLDLLKIDIEGAEYEVIDSILEDHITPKVLCIEFDQPVSLFKMIRYINRIKKSGYQLIKIDTFNFTFLFK